MITVDHAELDVFILNFSHLLEKFCRLYGYVQSVTPNGPYPPATAAKTRMDSAAQTSSPLPETFHVGKPRRRDEENVWAMPRPMDVTAAVCFPAPKIGRSVYCLQIGGRMSVPASSIEQYYKAIVEGSNDAIIAKDLDSRILSWNPAAERMFGYAEKEVLGEKIHFLIPEERRNEETNFISRLRQGERIQNFETIRIKKNGCRFPISVSISPIRDDSGHVIGASKIARDITARHLAAEQQSLLLSEMQHRVGNSFAIAGGLLGLCASHSSTIDDFVRDMRGRLRALATAHSLAAPKTVSSEGGERRFKSLLDAILAAFAVSEKVTEDVEDIPIKGTAVTPLSIIFYELCTNSIKYGALSDQNGTLSISAIRCGAKFRIAWRERFSGEAANQVNVSQGLGSLLCKMAAEEQLGGSLERTIHAGEVSVILDIDLANIAV